MKQRFLTIVRILVILVILLGFLFALNNLNAGHQEAAKAQLEDSVRRLCITCYALEGAYPPDIGYLQLHYGLTFDETRYAVHYQVISSNLFPEITILERIS